MKYAFILVLLLTVTIAFGQLPTEESIVKRLSSDNKEWRLTGTEIYLGKPCTSGQFLIFSEETKNVIKRTCDTKKGEFVDSIYSWSIKPINKVDWAITIGYTTYKMIFKETDSLITLTLRRRMGKSKGDLTSDSIYTYFKF